jgi:hypothetical protein
MSWAMEMVDWEALGLAKLPQALTGLLQAENENDAEARWRIIDGTIMRLGVGTLRTGAPEACRILVQELPYTTGYHRKWVIEILNQLSIGCLPYEGINKALAIQVAREVILGLPSYAHILETASSAQDRHAAVELLTVCASMQAILPNRAKEILEYALTRTGADPNLREGIRIELAGLNSIDDLMTWDE